MFKPFLVLGVALTLAAPAFAEGDPKKGKRVFKKCKSCHTLKEGDHRSGPSLYNIIGAAAGAKEGFGYSNEMANSGLTWDKDTLSEFLADPKAVVPDNKMSFRGLKKEAEIADLIAYLEEEQG